MEYMKALITGASSGLGREMAIVLTEKRQQKNRLLFWKESFLWTMLSLICSQKVICSKLCEAL